MLFADNEPPEDSGAFERWKSFLTSEWGLEVIHNGQLNGGDVPDHYLSPSAGGACSRRYLLLRAFQTSKGQGFGVLAPGDTVEILTARRNWRPATITGISDSKVKVAYSVPPHRVEEEVPLSSGHVRRAMISEAQAASRGVMPYKLSSMEGTGNTALPQAKQAPDLDTEADTLVAGVVDVAMWLTNDECAATEEEDAAPQEKLEAGTSQAKIGPATSQAEDAEGNETASTSAPRKRSVSKDISHQSTFRGSLRGFLGEIEERSASKEIAEPAAE